MASRRQNLFTRLTSLFRSGPLVKRKVRGFDTGNVRSSAIDVFRKSTATVYGNSLNAYGQLDRLSRYADFSEMEYTPEIASALDIYADETVAKDEKGFSLHIQSENPKIKRILEELYYDTLNFEFNARPWVRNLCKYGDFFLLTDVSPEFGVINVHPIPVNEIEREEGYDPNDPFAVRFRWVNESNQVLENWQVIHFRLLGNDTFLPYGSSVLESARRIWRQLIMAEDAMLVYRVIRSPERRVFYIDVANTPPADIPNVMEQARATLKSQEVVDKTAGRVDLRYNPWSVDIDYFLAVRGTETGTRVDTLAGGANTTAIDDVEYIQKKLFAALKVPKAYLGFEEALSSKSNLAQEDIRFARSIQQIQQIIISELNKIAAIHLTAHGYTGEDIVNFRIQLSNPSTMAQQQKLEGLRTKLEILGTRPEGMLSEKWLYREIGLNDNAIEQIFEEQAEELVRKAKMEQIGTGAAEGGEGGLGGGGDFGGGGGGLDFGGPEEGGDEDLGGDEEAPEIDTGEDEEDLFAHNKEVGPMITDDEDEVIETESEDDDYKPVHQQNQLSRYRHNNLRPSRRKSLGSKGLKTPDPTDALGHKDRHYGDMFAKRYKGNPFKLSDALDRQMSALEASETVRTRLSNDLKHTIDSITKSIRIDDGSSTLGYKYVPRKTKNVIKEEIFDEDEIDGIFEITDEGDNDKT